MISTISGIFSGEAKSQEVEEKGKAKVKEIANSVVNPYPQWNQPDKSDGKRKPWLFWASGDSTTQNRVRFKNEILPNIFPKFEKNIT